MSEPKDVLTTPSRCTVCDDDVHVDASMALIYSEMAPLPIDSKLKAARSKPRTSTTDDFKAVWAWVPPKPDPSVLVFFHGNSHYVTVGNLPAPEDAAKEGKASPKKNVPPPPSRMPDWTSETTDEAAAGLFYKLDELDNEQKALADDAGSVKSPVVLVPEDVEPYSGNWWSVPPLGQYKDPATFGNLVGSCYVHLRCQRDAPDPFQPYLKSTSDLSGPSYVKNLKRIYLCGHSGGGKPLGEAAGSQMILDGVRSGPQVDLWLFDCTYGSDITHYVDFCKLSLNKLGNTASTNRFVCVYKAEYQVQEWEDKKQTIPKIDPQTQKQKWHWEGTETQADELRGKIANVLQKPAKSLMIQHEVNDKKVDNLSSVIIPALQKSPVLFVKTHLGHEKITTVFVPVLLRTAGS